MYLLDYRFKAASAFFALKKKKSMTFTKAAAEKG
jgi:hypothetical protein